jgi:hypothetical protein
MKKDWEEQSEKAVKKYNKKIMDILQETGASGVIPLIKGLQKKIKTMEVREKHIDEQSREYYYKSAHLEYQLDEIKRIMEKQAVRSK